MAVRVGRSEWAAGSEGVPGRRRARSPARATGPGHEGRLPNASMVTQVSACRRLSHVTVARRPRPHAPPPKHVAALHPRAPQSAARELLAFFLSRRNAAAIAPREISVACHWGCVGEAGCVRVRPCGARPWERGPRGSSHAARKVGDEDARRNHTRFAIPFLNQASAPFPWGSSAGKERAKERSPPQALNSRGSRPRGDPEREGTRTDSWRQRPAPPPGNATSQYWRCAGRCLQKMALNGHAMTGTKRRMLMVPTGARRAAWRPAGVGAGG